MINCCGHFREIANDYFIVDEDHGPNGHRYFMRLQNQKMPGLACSVRFYFCPLCGKQIDLIRR